jgi:glutamine amidotransferase
MDVAIIDNGGANLASLRYALERLGAQSRVTSDPGLVTAAPRVLLPGVGAAGDAMRRLENARLVDTLRGLRKPVLGICLGMQLLFEHSAEGDTRCLGILSGSVRRLDATPDHPAPHTGWSPLTMHGPDPLLVGIADGDHAYFVHAYAADVGPDTTALARHALPLSAVVRHGNFHGVQFHPERSAAVGARVLKNFLELG